VAGKRIAVFLDGTWNNVDSNTNVWRLRSLVAEHDSSGKEQRVYYHAGVGTNRWEKVRGGIIGHGLEGEVLLAYRWLVENYDNQDDIFIFGFSRGAYTARSLAGLIATCGLLQPGAPLSVNQVYDRYRACEPPIWKLEYQRWQGQTLAPKDARLLDYSHRVPIKMIGVCDTVGALGIPFGNVPGLSRSSFQFLNTNLSVIYENAFHALAIDEHRKAFQPTLWTRFKPAVPDPEPHGSAHAQKVEQRWFVGAHANVGGGYVDDDLPQIPLEWLKAKSEALGLAFRFPITLRGGEQQGPVTDSFAAFAYGLYRFVRLNRRYYRTVGADEHPVSKGTSKPINETIDASVFERWRSDASYRPPSLKEWSHRRGVDPGSFSTSADAATAQPV
jgi:uncharacterized protein (DUF2235 family)